METPTRPVKTLSSSDGLYTPDTDLSTTPTDLTASELAEVGAESLSEQELLRLPADTVNALCDAVTDLSDDTIGVLQEASARGRFYGLFSHATELGDAWWDLGFALQDAVIDRYEDRHLSLAPSYTNEDGTESEALVYDRLLKDWVVEFQTYAVEDEDSRNPTTRTVTAKVSKQLPDLRAATAPWKSASSFSHCWQLAGVGEDEGRTFALATHGYGDSQVMLWTHDDFADEWDNPSHVFKLVTWPSKRTYDTSTTEIAN